MVQKFLSFVRGIGIPVVAEALHEPTFLPGLTIRAGVLLVDEARLLYPGDILHEAGHIAVASPENRSRLELIPTDGDEVATLAWSYAAACILNIAPEVVFHPAGYTGGADALAENFRAGRPIGVPLLQLYGMTLVPRVAAERGLPAYPHMIRWVR